jgi:hypothetical protein
LNVDLLIEDTDFFISLDELNTAVVSMLDRSFVLFPQTDHLFLGLVDDIVQSGCEIIKNSLNFIMKFVHESAIIMAEKKYKFGFTV